MAIRILTTRIETELDVVSARQRARQIANICGFGTQDQIRIATSVSELARNVFNYASRGRALFAIEGDTAPQILTIDIEDDGPGISNLALILSGGYKSSTGMGKGLLGARRLMDKFDIVTGEQSGTKITLQKIFPREAKLVTPMLAGNIFSGLASIGADSTMSEVLQQNQELLGALEELKERQDDLLHLTHELEDTNRGVVALYAELDEKADHLRRADEMKSRFLSNMSHEFRTPLSSIRALAKLLLDRIDGDLSEEQEKQVNFILQAALGLTDLVNDLLDIAKIEAGKIEVHTHEFDVTEMFSSLRGMLRPLLVSQSLKLNFIEPEDKIELFSDEAKLSQILRNFISNALKFTTEGEINVGVEILDDTLLRFSVSDTGLGIEENHLSLIFEEFSQIENSLQRHIKGTGLGLPLCRSLATILGGRVDVESEVGIGSTFSVTLPRRLILENGVTTNNQSHAEIDEGNRIPVLVVEDSASERLLYEKYLEGTEFRAIPARTVREAVDIWATSEPAAVILDIILYGEHAWPWLAELKNDPNRRAVPVIVATEVEDRRKGLSLGADAYFVKPINKPQLVSTLRKLVGSSYTASRKSLLSNS